MRTRLPGVLVEYGYLEFADPVIHAGLEKLRGQGVARILAAPAMLFAAGHAKNDIPSVLNTYAAAHPGLDVTYGREFGVDAVREIDDVQRAGPHVRHAAAGRIGVRVENRTGYGDRPHRTSDQIGDEGATRQRERGDRNRVVRGVGDDAGGLLAGPLTSSSLTRRKAVVLARGEQGEGIGDEPLGGGVDVENP